MPASPVSPSIPSAVRYLWPVASAIWARKRAQRTIRTLLHSDQHVLDQVLKELGRAARAESLNAPAVAEDMRRVREQEDRRTHAEESAAQAIADLAAEDSRWNADEAARKAELARREEELRANENELRRLGEERRAHEAERNRVEAQIRNVEKKAAQATQQAAKAELTPPEKGGGAGAAANLRGQAEAARREAAALTPARDQARAKAEALEEPINALSQKIVEGRATLAEKKKDLADAAAAHKKEALRLAAERKRADEERSDSDREISQRFVSVGTMLNLNRVEGERYRPLYSRIDELKSGVNAREATIVRLESELRTYDRSAVQTGLITLGVLVGVLIILGIVLVVLLAR
jgi:hypothetical protein